MDWINYGITLREQINSSPKFQRCITTYKKHYKNAYIWTLETGCLVFTSFIVYYLTFLSSRQAKTMDTIVTVLFIFGAIAYLASSSFFRQLNTVFEDNALINIVKTTNRYVFMALSFLPGLYFAFQYDEFILRLYIVIHLVTSAYFFYKRFKDFQLIPFLAGLGMSFAIKSISPSIRFFFALFGDGWFPSTCSYTLETLVDTGLAIAFILRLPEKYFPPSLTFGLKILKYLMFIVSWKSFFILMIFISWKNIGAATQTLLEFYLSSKEKQTPKAEASTTKSK